MREIKIAKLSGAALDWAVAQCEGFNVVHNPMGFENGSASGYWIWDESNPRRPRYQLIGDNYTPSTSWLQAGPLIEKHDCFPSRDYGCAEDNPEKFHAGSGVCWVRGNTPLVAAMRSIVASTFGDEIKVPEGLV